MKIYINLYNSGRDNWESLTLSSGQIQQIYSIPKILLETKYYSNEKLNFQFNISYSRDFIYFRLRMQQVPRLYFLDLACLGNSHYKMEIRTICSWLKRSNSEIFFNITIPIDTYFNLPTPPVLTLIYILNAFINIYKILFHPISLIFYNRFWILMSMAAWLIKISIDFLRQHHPSGYLKKNTC